MTNLRKRRGKDVTANSDLTVKSDSSKHSYNSQSNLIFVTITVIVGLYILFPFIFKTSLWFRCQLIFMNNINLTPKFNYSHPERVGVNCSRNFYLPSESEIILGMWHILPNSLKNQKCVNNRITDTDTEFDDDRPIVMYVHGSGGNRGARHRVAMYNVLSQSKVDAHIVTFDYRGFGDSSSSPTNATDVVTDAFTVYKWLTNKGEQSRVYLWCHSLGAGVCLKLVSDYSISPKGVVLESPFRTVYDAMKDFPLMIFYRHLPSTLYNYLFIEPCVKSGINFDNERVIGYVKLPILILHAEDDHQIPYSHSEYLHLTALKNGANVQYISYDASLGYGHLSIHRDPNLPNTILLFIKSLEKS